MIGRVEARDLIDLRWRALCPDKPRSAAHMGGDNAATTRHWGLYVDGALVGGVSVMALRGLALRGMVVEPALQRRGLGARLLRRVHEDVAAPMWCNARLAAASFYAAGGWVAVGPLFPMDDEGLHQRMIWSP